MKYIKLFENMLNEDKYVSLVYLGEDEFKFYLKVNNDEKPEVIEKFGEYLDAPDCRRLKRLFKNHELFSFLVYMSYGNGGIERTSIQCLLCFTNRTNVENDDDTYTGRELVELGLEGIKADVEAKEVAQKYNL